MSAISSTPAFSVWTWSPIPGFKNERSQADVKRTLAELSRAANSKNDNVFSKVVEATAAGVTHGEVVGCLRQELGFGHPLIVD